MSAKHQLKKTREAIRLDNFFVGKKRRYHGVVYASRKDVRIAREAAHKDAALIEKLQKETNHGRKEADSSAP